jgi:outer membrane protein OmpA-like peptidoglycan-associated protein
VEQPVVEPAIVEPEPDVAAAPTDATSTDAYQEPVPIPEPAPPPTPDDISFTIYFELMKSTLTEAAVAELSARLSDVDIASITAVEIGGYTDTAGTNDYNLPLSERRAAVVRRFLTDRGVDEASIAIRGYGETGLALSTADGVREPLNRRTEILIQFD